MKDNWLQADVKLLSKDLRLLRRDSVSLGEWVTHDPSKHREVLPEGLGPEPRSWETFKSKILKFPLAFWDCLNCASCKHISLK
jgi:hypothetical protein